MVRSHYNQKARLKEFARKEGNNWKLTMVDVKNKEIGSRNIKSAFYEKGLYSDELEKELSYKVEKPGMKIFGKVYKSENTVILTRKEVEMMKKYLLIQRYRNPPNIATYSPNYEKDIFHYNKKFENKGESYKEYVCRMMQEILDYSWDDLCKSNNEEVRNNVLLTNSCATLFVRSNFEFVINDPGYVTERHEFYFNDGPITKKIFKDSLIREGLNPTDADIEKFLKEHQYHDNFLFYPISSKFGIVTLSEIWTGLIKTNKPYRYDNNGIVKNDYVFEKIYGEYGLYSEFIMENYLPCINWYESDKLYNVPREKEAELFSKYKSPDDKYICPIVDLDLHWAQYLNALTINEAVNYFAFGNNVDGKISICNYEMERLTASNQEGFKKDLSWIDVNGNWDIPLK